MINLLLNYFIIFSKILKYKINKILVLKKKFLVIPSGALEAISFSPFPALPLFFFPKKWQMGGKYKAVYSK
jgi:hypothetical protein